MAKKQSNVPQLNQEELNQRKQSNMQHPINQLHTTQHMSQLQNYNNMMTQQTLDFSPSAVQIDSIVDSGVRKIKQLDTLVNSETDKKQLIDSLVNKGSLKIDSIANNKIEQLKKIIK